MLNEYSRDYFKELWRTGTVRRGIFRRDIPEIAMMRFATAVGKRPAYIVAQGALLEIMRRDSDDDALTNTLLKLSLLANDRAIRILQGAAISAHNKLGMSFFISREKIKTNVLASYNAAELMRVLSYDELREVDANYDKYGTSEEGKRVQSDLVRKMVRQKDAKWGLPPTRWTSL